MMSRDFFSFAVFEIKINFLVILMKTHQVGVHNIFSSSHFDEIP